MFDWKLVLFITLILIVISIIIIIVIYLLETHSISSSSTNKSYAYYSYYNRDHNTNSFDLTGYVYNNWEKIRSPIKVLLDSNSNDFISNDESLIYTGSESKYFKMTLSAAIYADIPDHIMEWGVFRNLDIIPYKNLDIITNSLYAIDKVDTGTSSTSAIGLINPGDKLTIMFNIVEPYTNTLVNVENINLCVTEV